MKNPRKQNTLGTMYCMHRKYNFGDIQLNRDDYTNWQNCGVLLAKQLNAAVILPLYLLDHSGQTVSTHPFNDQWDSGQIGFLLVSRERVAQWYEKKYCTEKLINQARKELLSEVQDYDLYLQGDEDEDEDDDYECQ